MVSPFRVEQSNGATWVRFRERRLGGPSAEALGPKLLRLADRPWLRLDFAGVEFLGAAVLGALLGLRARVRAAEGELTLENLRPEVYEVFETTRLTQLFPIHRQEARVSPSDLLGCDG
jgi:anti-anti-sigma factor